MNAAASSGGDKTAAKTANRGDGESGKNPGGVPVHDAPPMAQPMTDGGQASSAIEPPAPGNTAATSGASSGSSTQASVQSAEDAVAVPDGPPRRRRGILLGTGAGPAAPAAVDDEKSLSWMATQAVKAANAVKASQLEQFQAWKAEAGTALDEPPRLTDVDDVAIEGQDSARSLPGGQPASMHAAPVGEEYPGAPRDNTADMPVSGPTDASRPPAETAVTEQSATGQAVQPVEPSPAGAVNPRIPAGTRRATASLMPVRLALMLGVLAMFSYAGYRYWFAGERVASEAPGSASAIIEPAGPAEEANLMTPPAISAVPAPPSSARSTKPGATAVEAGTAPTPEPAPEVQPATATAPGEPAAEAANRMTSPPVSVVTTPQPTAGSTRPEASAVEAGPAPTPEPAPVAQPATAAASGEPAAEAANRMTPPPVSAVPEPQPAAGSPQPEAPAVEAGVAPLPGSATGTQPAPAHPASAAMPQAWYPAAVPAAPSPAVEAGVAATQPMPSSSPPPPAEPESAASQPTSPSSPAPVPAPAVEAREPARPAPPPAPATRPRYPANGYGYYQPPASWQPYYRPGYPQAPARQ